MKENVVIVIEMETIKQFLRHYSRLLRRDFLCILVKMSAQQFKIPTKRLDWRTRDGMFNFLQSIWIRLYPLLHEKTIFNWYLNYFQHLEKILSMKKFMMFIYNNWDKFQSILTDPDVILYMKNNENKISELVKEAYTRTIDLCVQYPEETKINGIIALYKSHLELISKPVLPKPIRREETNENMQNEYVIPVPVDFIANEYAPLDLFYKNPVI